MPIDTPQTEKAILAAALEALQAEAGLRMDIEQEQVRVGDRYVDAILKLREAPGEFAVEVKKWAPHANLDALIYQILRLPTLNGHRMLVADHINPQMAQRLKAEGIQFIDTMGNAYINAPPVYVYVKGQGKALKAAAPKGNRAFEPTGLKVVFTFLCNPQLATAPYRTIADLADVALGTVGWVVTGLRDAGFLIEKGRRKGRQLVNYQKLLDRWVEEYPLKLRPKQLIGTFVADNPNWWEELNVTEYGALLGGEPAAAKLTHYLKPKTTTIYARDAFKNQLFAKARFRKADDRTHDLPKVEVYRQFWNEGDWHHGFAHLDNQLQPDIVHPVLIYADLIASGNARNRETADIIFGDYIAKYCREN